MEEIYSVVEKDLLLHVVWRREDFGKMSSFREGIIGPSNFIQCSALNMDGGKTFRPHQHIYKKRSYNRLIAQESWIVVQGSVLCRFYDIDGSLVAEPVLNSGDASFTLHGGHTYVVLEDDTIVYEYKTGPYEGQEFDKKFI